MDWGVAQDGAAGGRAGGRRHAGLHGARAGQRAARVDAPRRRLRAGRPARARCSAPTRRAPLRAIAAKARAADPRALSRRRALAADLARFRNQDPVEAYRESRRAPAAALSPLRAADPAGPRVYPDAGRAAGVARDLRVQRTGCVRRTLNRDRQEELMKKPVFAMLLGGVLGVFDGLTALISGARRCRRDRAESSSGSTLKGVVAGLIIGLVAQQDAVDGDHRGCRAGGRRVLAYLVTIGGPYLWEIVLPGSVVGLIVGFATVKYRGGSEGPGPKASMPQPTGSRRGSARRSTRSARRRAAIGRRRAAMRRREQERRDRGRRHQQRCRRRSPRSRCCACRAHVADVHHADHRQQRTPTRKQSSR